MCATHLHSLGGKARTLQCLVRIVDIRTVVHHDSPRVLSKVVEHLVWQYQHGLPEARRQDAWVTRIVTKGGGKRVVLVTAMHRAVYMHGLMTYTA